MQIWNGSDKYCWRYRAGTIVSTDGQTDGQTDGRTDKVKPLYPPFNFVEAGGIMSVPTWEWFITRNRWRHHQKTHFISIPLSADSSRQWLSWPTTDLSINNSHCLQSVYCHREGHAAWHWGTHSALQWRLALTYSGLLTPYGVEEIGQHWFR